MLQLTTIVSFTNGSQILHGQDDLYISMVINTFQISKAWNRSLQLLYCDIILPEAKNKRSKMHLSDQFSS